MWIPLLPPPADFCGRPPCPKCFRWDGGEDQKAGIAQFALEFLGRAPKDAAERAQIKTIAKQLHDGVFAKDATEPTAPFNDDDAVDIGMNPTRHLNAFLRQNRPIPKPEPRKFTCDEIADRQADRKAAKAIEKQKRDERLKEVREVAEIFAAAQPQQGQSGADDRALERAGVDPGFISYMHSRGVYNANEIHSEAKRQGAMRRDPRMYDPVRDMRSPFKY